MRSRHGTRAGLGGAVAMALGVLALMALPSLAAAKDRNHDHISDRWEKRHHLSLRVNQAARDQDRDHLDNRGEFKAGDNPRDEDTDNDGVMDGEENAGTITAYDTETGKLTISLFGGGTVSGIVTEETRIRCGHECNHGQDEDGSDDSGASASSHGEDNSGPSGPGDDNSGPSAQSDDGTDAANCSPDDLVVGATVAEAELELEHGVATFEEIDLAP
jgi:hypothetical protein